MAQTDTRPGFRLPWTTEHGAQTDQAQAMASETDTPSAQGPDAEFNSALLDHGAIDRGDV